MSAQTVFQDLAASCSIWHIAPSILLKVAVTVADLQQVFLRETLWWILQEPPVGRECHVLEMEITLIFFFAFLCFVCMFCVQKDTECKDRTVFDIPIFTEEFLNHSKGTGGGEQGPLG